MPAQVASLVDEVLASSSSFDLGPFGYPQQDAWALPPVTMQIFATLQQRLRPRRVIEFGSGRSTVITATHLRRDNGRLLSFDHDPNFGSTTIAAVRNAGLADIAEVNIRPITWRMYGAKLLPIYDLDWRQHADFGACELALIDGPPGVFGREAVMYELFPRLMVGAWVVVDDMIRLSEQLWLERWQRVFGDALEAATFLEIGRGVAFVRKTAERKPHYWFPIRQTLGSWRHAARTILRPPKMG